MGELLTWKSHVVAGPWDPVAGDVGPHWPGYFLPVGRTLDAIFIAPGQNLKFAYSEPWMAGLDMNLGTYQGMYGVSFPLALSKGSASFGANGYWRVH